MEQEVKLLVVLWTFLGLTTVTVGLRCYVRLAIAKSFGVDDWFMVIGYGLFASLVAVLVVSIHYGLGKHALDLESYQQINAAKYLIIGELIYIIDSGFIKISVGLLLLRLAVVPIHRYILHASIYILALWTTVTFLIVAFQCRPLSLAWNPASGTGTCMAAISITRLGYAFSALDIGSDFLYAFLPVAMLWNIQMTWKLKFSICIVLSFGIFASVATIVRLKYLIALTDEADVLFAICITQMWTIIEVGIGMVAGSIATLRPLLRKMNITGLGSSDQYTRESNYKSQELGYIKQSKLNTQSSTTKVAANLGQDNDSQELIWGEDRDIHKRVDVSISRTQ
ncbi:hypothetical protein VE01_03129 [Pseudogymnoascus verrucosus]|uniref:Rhodopsin domain-containing protein n=1 Tax=Pseudogymnoascus verrucosus TaxID=342668 RepID=A0A1B8GRE4_9PEZI|nr:uncharacterized protein VE01_03129 [Pseudogymnoascus verrucosus]OBT98391.1 hypothetical protein VE01_03129 [Pseudogymnoascus verrucosus]